MTADRAYDADALRSDLAARSGWANVRPVVRRSKQLAFSPFPYRYRNRAECFINDISYIRAVATRYEKDPANFLVLVKLAAIGVSLRRILSVA